MLLSAFELHATCWLIQVLFFLICIVVNADLTHNHSSFACSLDVLNLHATCWLIHTLMLFFVSKLITLLIWSVMGPLFAAFCCSSNMTVAGPCTVSRHEVCTWIKVMACHQTIMHFILSTGTGYHMVQSTACVPSSIPGICCQSPQLAQVMPKLLS